MSVPTTCQQDLATLRAMAMKLIHNTENALFNMGIAPDIKIARSEAMEAFMKLSALVLKLCTLEFKLTRTPVSYIKKATDQAAVELEKIAKMV